VEPPTRRRLRILENKMLRIIFRPKKGVELYGKKTKMGGACGTYEKQGGAYRVLMGKRETDHLEKQGGR
jgi:hypothetical protein